MFKHILVPLDGSVQAEVALPAALELASRLGSELTLVRVVVPAEAALSLQRGYAASFVQISKFAQYLREQAAAYLAERCESTREQGVDSKAKVVEAENVAEAILNTAKKVGADAIVISTHGRGGFRRWLLGSVTERVLRQATIPVLLIRANSEPEANAGREFMDG